MRRTLNGLAAGTVPRANPGALGCIILQHFNALVHCSMRFGQHIYLFLLAKDLVLKLGIGHFQIGQLLFNASNLFSSIT